VAAAGRTRGPVRPGHARSGMTAGPQQSATDGTGGAERRAGGNRGPDWAAARWAAAREEKEKQPEGAVGCCCVVQAAGPDRGRARVG
jgi:hypothetical protein